MRLSAEGEELRSTGVKCAVPQGDLVIQHDGECDGHVHAAGNIDMAQQTLEAGDSAAVLDGVGVHAARPQAYHHANRPLGAHHACRGGHVLRFDPADLGGVLRCPFLHAGLQVFETVGPVLDPLLVVPSLVDDLTDDAQRQSAVSAGAWLDGQVCVLRHVLEARIDDDEVGAAGLVVQDALHDAALHGRVLPPEHHGA